MLEEWTGSKGTWSWPCPFSPGPSNDTAFHQSRTVSRRRQAASGRHIAHYLGAHLSPGRFPNACAPGLGPDRRHRRAGRSAPTSRPSNGCLWEPVRSRGSRPPALTTPGTSGRGHGVARSPARPLGGLGAPCALPALPTSPVLLPHPRGGAAEGRPVTSPPSILPRRATGLAGPQLGTMWAAVRRSRAAWTRALLLPLLLAGPGGCLSRQELFPFGPQHEDLELAPGDDRVSPALELSTALRFFDKSDIHSVYVSVPRAGRGGWRSDRGPERRREEGGRWPGLLLSRTDVGVGGGDRPAGRQALGARWVSKPSALPPLPGPRRLHWSVSPRSPRGWGAGPICAAPLAPCPLQDPKTSRPRHLRRSGAVRGIGLTVVRSLWGQDPARWDQVRARKLREAAAGAGEQRAPDAGKDFPTRLCALGAEPTAPALVCVSAGCLGNGSVLVELVAVQNSGLGSPGDPRSCKRTLSPWGPT